MGRDEIELFLTSLAVNRKVSSSTQALALNALMFLYNKYMDKPIEDMKEFKRAKRKRKIPVMLTQDDVKKLLSHLPLKSMV
jgi:integrase